MDLLKWTGKWSKYEKLLLPNAIGKVKLNGL